MNKLNYEKLGKILLNIVKKFEKNPIIFSIPYLHFVRGHPKYSFIYPEIFEKGEFKISKDYSLIKKIIKNLGYFDEVKSFRYLKNKKALIVNNIINEKEYNSNNSFYTGELNEILKKKNISFVNVYRNFTSKTYKNTSNKFILSKIYNFSWEILTVCKLFLEKIKFIFLKINNKKLTKLENYFLKKSFKIINLFGALSTLRTTQQVQDIIEHVKPDMIFLPIEGHVWEKNLIKNIRLKYKNIRLYGIQFSSIIEKDNPFKKSLGKLYEPDVLICNKYLNFLIVKNNKFFKYSKIIYNDLRINKKKKLKKKNFSKINCLIAPELNLFEVEKFIEFILTICKKNREINFTLKLHPQTSKNDTDKIKKKINNQIKISTKNLKEEFIENNVLIYRGSSSCFEALNNGLWLLYYDSKKYDINPVREIKLKDNYFSNDIEFLKIIDNLKNITKVKVNKFYYPQQNQRFLNGNYK